MGQVETPTAFHETGFSEERKLFLFHTIPSGISKNSKKGKLTRAIG